MLWLPQIMFDLMFNLIIIYFEILERNYLSLTAPTPVSMWVVIEKEMSTWEAT